MSWTGQGAFIAWHDVEEGQEAEYLHWHSHEHMQERCAIPGFLQGRRYSVIGPGPQFLVIYEVEDLTTLSSAAYRERLDNPSDWTRRTMPSLRNMNRSLCKVVMSAGSGAGCYMQTVRFSPEQGRGDGLVEGLRQAVMAWVCEPCLTGAHLLIADPVLSGTPTREQHLRGGQDHVADWVLLVEGFQQDAVAASRSEWLLQAGAEPDVTTNLYALQHLL
jgi:hypothetical protein